MLAGIEEVEQVRLRKGGAHLLASIEDLFHALRARYASTVDQVHFDVCGRRIGNRREALPTRHIERAIEALEISRRSGIHERIV